MIDELTPDPHSHFMEGLEYFKKQINEYIKDEDVLECDYDIDDVYGDDRDYFGIEYFATGWFQSILVLPPKLKNSVVVSNFWDGMYNGDYKHFGENYDNEMDVMINGNLVCEMSPIYVEVSYTKEDEQDENDFLVFTPILKDVVLKKNLDNMIKYVASNIDNFEFSPEIYYTKHMKKIVVKFFNLLIELLDEGNLKNNGAEVDEDDTTFWWEMGNNIGEHLLDDFLKHKNLGKDHILEAIREHFDM